LQDASGGGLAKMMSASPFYLHAHSGYVTYDQILELAGQGFPMEIGGHSWYHWTGVRGRDGDNLLLANPAPGYKGISQSLTRGQAGNLGPFACVWITPS
jgi:hypothetical protein